MLSTLFKPSARMRKTRWKNVMVYHRFKCIQCFALVESGPLTRNILTSCYIRSQHLVSYVSYCTKIHICMSTTPITSGKNDMIFIRLLYASGSSPALLIPALQTVLPLPPALLLLLRLLHSSPRLLLEASSVKPPAPPLAISSLRLRSWASRAARVFSASACSSACCVSSAVPFPDIPSP